MKASLKSSPTDTGLTFSGKCGLGLQLAAVHSGESLRLMSMGFRTEGQVGEPFIRTLGFLQGFSLKYNMFAKTLNDQILVSCSCLITYIPLTSHCSSHTGLLAISQT